MYLWHVLRVDIFGWVIVKTPLICFFCVWILGTLCVCFFFLIGKGWTSSVFVSSNSMRMRMSSVMGACHFFVCVLTGSDFFVPFQDVLFKQKLYNSEGSACILRCWSPTFQDWKGVNHFLNSNMMEFYKRIPSTIMSYPQECIDLFIQSKIAWRLRLISQILV